MVVFVALTTVETVIVHLVLLAIFGEAIWVWVLFVVSAYTPIWIFARYYASMAVLPHEVGPDRVLIRAGSIGTLEIPREAILEARMERSGRGGGPGKLFTEDSEGLGRAWLTNGEGNVALLLAPRTTLLFNGKPIRQRMKSVHVTADGAPRMVAEIASWMRGAAA